MGKAVTYAPEAGASGRADITSCDLCLHALTGRCPRGACERRTGVCLTTGGAVSESHPGMSNRPGATS